MPISLGQALTSRNLISTLNGWFMGITTVLYLGLAFSVTWTRTTLLVVLASYLQWGLVHFAKCKRPQFIEKQLSLPLKSTLSNLAILSAVLMALGYATILLFTGRPSWRLLQQVILAALICGCLLGANLIVLKKLFQHPAH
ncbi:hypothetical protein RA086_04435 [Lactiplantibacillus sp. WILCCON 0030]|uniref:GtrA-like protein domain-containing protein n=1 Tax=Lactiplantibacillus brownii TaxID=3069269 RepID=A0ABU1A7F8_9LACO|nr:hypothetical protein [Lactiplantibacillus brownii]MDQ7936889.1 hypothetical protein [Lactiplantibacillus brownii]